MERDINESGLVNFAVHIPTVATWEPGVELIFHFFEVKPVSK